MKVKNVSNPTQSQLNADGWSHPVDVDTHVKKSKVWYENPDYQGAFKVTVTCDDGCICDGVYELV